MVFEKIAALLAEKLECEVSTITMETKFADLGIDSLDVMELLMSLEEKEKTRANMVLFWSPRILGYLRKNEAPDMPERLGRSDDLRPLERDGILWDQLILRDYVHFCVQEPLYSGEGPENPKELESAAVNPLLLPTRRPEQDKTVAEYLGKDKGTISYHNKNLNKKFRELLGIKDTKPVKEN